MSSWIVRSGNRSGEEVMGRERPNQARSMSVNVLERSGAVLRTILHLRASYKVSCSKAFAWDFQVFHSFCTSNFPRRICLVRCRLHFKTVAASLVHAYG